MPLLILMGQSTRNSERFGMGDFNFAPTVVKMQRRARIARLARVQPGKEVGNQQLRLICPEMRKQCRRVVRGPVSSSKRKEVQERCGNRTNLEVPRCPLTRSQRVRLYPRPQATNQPPRDLQVLPPHRRQPPIRPLLVRAWWS